MRYCRTTFLNGFTPILVLLILSIAVFAPGSVYAATYTYDDLNRVSKVVYDDGKTVLYQYDAVGNLTVVVPETGEIPTYSWQAGQWDACEGQPGSTGVQTRDVYCEQNDGTRVDDSMCVDLNRPDDTQSCTVPTPIDIGSVESSGYNNIVTFCGINTAGKIQNVTATCTGNWTVNPCAWESSCDSEDGWTFASVNENCTADCPTYSWQTGQWGDCEGEPGSTGMQIRDVYCERDDGTRVSDSMCSALTKPDDTQSCIVPHEPPTPIDIGSVESSGCNNIVTFCGINTAGKIQHVTATCTGNWTVNPCEWESSCDSEGGWTSSFVDENCTADCPTYSWQTGQWGACEGQPGSTGAQTRDVYCERNDGTRVGDSMCAALNRPDDTQSCTVPQGPPTPVDIGSVESSGYNNIVTFCGINTAGKIQHVTATCTGNWTVNPCEWESSCDSEGGWASASVDENCTADCP